MTDIVIVGAVRTPMGKFLGRVSQFKAPELGAEAIKGLLHKTGVSGDQVDEVIMGNVVQAGEGQAPARQAAIGGGVSATVPAVTVNKVCGSGMKALISATQAIKCGDANAIIAGGMESMSNVPYLMYGMRKGVKAGDQKLVDGMIHDGLWCAFEKHHMGLSAEYTANKSSITREMQDEFSFQSHQKALAAMESGAFANELIPLEAKDGIIDQDETPRADTTLERLGGIRTAFSKEGTVTAGNAPGLNDGASALLVMSAEEAEKRGLKPLAKIVAYAAAGTEPIDLFYAPVESTKKLFKNTGMSVSDFDLIEVNEAFAAQVLADGKELAWDWDRVNVHGGAVALGHPIGCSGARIVTTLTWALHQHDKEWGLATICMGGGNGLTMAIQRM